MTVIEFSPKYCSYYGCRYCRNFFKTLNDKAQFLLNTKVESANIEKDKISLSCFNNVNNERTKFKI